MKATVAVQMRVTLDERRQLKRAARGANEKLSVYVRRVALERAELDLRLDEWATKTQEATP